MTNAQNTVANQYLNSILRVGAKPLMIISILLTAMFILAACGGGAAAPAGVTPTVDPCEGNPFGNTCTTAEHATARSTVVQTCLAAGAANTPACADAIVAEPCIVNPQADACATDTDFIAYLPAGQTIETVRDSRTAFCEIPANRNTAAICGGVLANCNAANPFANDLCDGATGIAGLRTTYCTNAATTWNDNCDAEGTYTGTAVARDLACRTYGTNAGGDADCHDRAALLAACPVTDPFAVAGCGSADGIAALRTTYCTTGNAIFDLECGTLDGTTEVIAGTNTARDNACVASGTDAGIGNDCATRANIIATCTQASPFTNEGCETATHITDTDRTAFCVNTAVNNGENPFNAGCNVTLASTLEDNRDTACFAFGDDASALCKSRPNVRTACNDNPFMKTTGLDTNVDLCTGMNADDGEAYSAQRTAICTTGKTIFNTECDGDNYGATATERANLIATCMETPDSYFCTTVRVDGSTDDSIPTVAECNTNPFLTGCATIPEFNAGRISICTTDATSFTAGCEETTHGEVNAARLSFATACADDSTPTDGCDTTFINGGNDGSTVDACNTNPFETDCAAIPAFEAGRVSICTTEATLFNPGCTNDNYDTSRDARAALIATCADSATESNAECTGTYVNGVDGTTVAECIANPFLDACDDSVDDVFAGAQAAREDLCVATNDPFNTACDLTGFPNDISAARDTYCRETATAGEATGVCLGDRFTAICTTEATYNPFAALCGTANATERAAFCGVNTENPNCGTVEATLCAANPFGTALGTNADVDCTSGTTYDGQRKTLADACRVDSTGSGCTVAINNCNADPFGTGCDAVAFADSITSYCTDPETTWDASCDAMADATSENTVTVARSNVCAANGALTGAANGEVAAGASLFNTDCTTLTGADLMRVTDAQAAYCIDPETTWNASCDAMADATSENTVTVARSNVCAANGALAGAANGEVAAGASLFNTDCTTLTGADLMRVTDAQAAYCIDPETTWNASCDAMADATSENTVTVARSNVCAANGALTGAANGEVAAGASLFNTDCTTLTGADLMRVTDAQAAYCIDPETTWNASCDAMADATSENTVTVARSNVCAANGALAGAANGEVAAGASLFNTDCTTLTGADLMRVTDAQAAYCIDPETTWNASCDASAGDGASSNTVTVARSGVCAANGAIMTGTEADDVAAGASLFHADCLALTADIMTITDAQVAYCTGDNIFDTECGALDLNGDFVGTTRAARAAACEGSLVSLGPKAPVDACVAESVAICGDTTTPGSAPFSAICGLAARNPATGADIVPTQQAFCRLNDTNNGLEICTDTIATFCGPKSAPKATETAVFDGLCLGDEYEAAQRTYCSVTAILDDMSCADNMQNSLSVRDVVCNGDNAADTPYATVCGMDNVAAQETFCGLTHETDPTDCAATRTVACANTDGNNPFNEALCFEDGNTFDAQRTARADACREGTVDNTNTATCPTAVNTCNGAPFGVDGAACDATVYANALVAFCTVGDDIFDERCETQSIAGTADARLARCAGAIADLGSSSTDTTCLTESVAICGTTAVEGTSPFAEICDDANRNTNHAELVNIRGFYCGNNDRRFGCADDDANLVTSGDFARGQATPLNTDPTAESQFLEIAADSAVISTAGTDTVANGTDSLPTPTTLDFGDLAYGGVELGLADTDGVAFFTGFHGATEYAYAGIFGTTDLGAPIATDGFGAVWNGALQLSGVADAIDFSLTVVFTSGSGIIGGFITDINSTMKDLSITGTFDGNGLITGNVHYNEFADNLQLTISEPNGVLSGLIGTDGAVGVFYNTAGELYVGGFVVSPTATACATDVFAATCPVRTEQTAQEAFCQNATANGGRNPFNAMCGPLDGVEIVAGTDMVRDTACLAQGTTADNSCATRQNIINTCTLDPFSSTGCDTATGIAGFRTAYCVTNTATIFNSNCGDADLHGATNNARDTACLAQGTTADNSCATRQNIINTCTLDPFSSTGCDTATGIAGFRTAYCVTNTATIFNSNCGDADLHGATNNARDTACLAQGTTADNSCATRQNIINTCTLDPFSSTGCDTATGIAGFRTAYCVTNTATIFNSNCGDADLHGATNNARDTACLAQGTTADNSCATRQNIINTCTLDPFSSTGCDTATGIAGFRTAYCVTNTATIFNSNCGDADLHGATNNARDTACLAQGTTADNSCATRQNIINTCTLDPFSSTGCDTATGIAGFRTAYCVTNTATIFNSNCGDADLHGATNNARDTACLAQGTTADNSCATRQNIINTCTLDPFSSTGCDTATGIAGFRTAYCVTNTATIFNSNCGDADLHGATNNARDTACLAQGTTADNSCATRQNIINTCTLDPFSSTGCDTATGIAGFRTAYCVTNTATIFNSNCGDADLHGATNNARDTACLAQGTTADNSCATRQNIINTCTLDPFSSTGCDTATGIAGFRTAYCVTNTATIFNSNCGDADLHGATNNARDTACLAQGTTADNSCATRQNIINTCTLDPFSSTGCDTATGIAGFRTAYCVTNTATIFNSNCGDADLHGATNAARDAACLAQGTTADNSCATRQNIINTCTLDPFSSTGCDTATGIAGFRTAYCVTNTATIFNSNCGDADLHGATNNARDTACLAQGTTADNSCATRQNIINTCTLDPFSSTGCDTATGIAGFRTAYCVTNTATIFNSNCGDADLHGATNAARDAACLAQGTTADNSCATRQNIINTCTLDPFSSTGCDTADAAIVTNLQRGEACVGLSASQRTANNCGNEAGVGGTYIQAYCATDAGKTNVRDCPLAYVKIGANVPATATVTKLTSGGVDRALNATGTGPLTGADGFKSGAVAQTSNRADFFIDVVRDPSNTNLEIPSIQSAGHLTLNSLDPSNNNGLSGFALARSQYVNNEADNRYVGLLAGTDLGAPLTANFTATWNAMIMVIVNRSDTIQNTFQMAVDFNTRSIKNNVVVNVAGFGDILIDGKFTANGVIYGSVGVNNNPLNLGTLTGLIGKKGAVGIFKSSNTTSNPYVGGFVAAPELVDVTAAGFRGKARNATDTDVLNVLEATALNRVPGTVNFIEGNSDVFALPEGAAIAKSRKVTLTADTNTGVAFTFGNAISGTANYHVGLLSGANVGPVLNSNSSSGDWAGKIAGIVGVDAVAEAEITFDVDFNASSFKVKDGESVDFGNLGVTAVNGNFLDNGVVYGTVNFGGATNNPGVLTGLIGQNALIGAFAGDGTGNSGADKPYVGGFVATPNTEPPVEIDLNCTDDLGATPFDEACEDNDDLQVQLCVDKDPLASAGSGFTANCEENTTVTNLVCNDSGTRANPFDTLCKDATIGTLTQKKNPLFGTANLLKV